MKALFTLLASVALLCGCHTESNKGGTGTENNSEVQTNSSANGMVQTNTQGSGAANLANTNSAAPSSQ